MPSTVESLTRRQLVRPPAHVVSNTMYETVTGSVAYGVSGDSSDMDIYGFCIPSKHLVFPHITGEILGFGTPGERFEVWEKHHVFDKDALGGRGRNHDFTIFSIVRYFHLCYQSNPNMIDTLFTPRDCILHITKIGELVRENRHKFLCKGAWHKFKGYSYSQLHKMQGKDAKGKRKELIEKYGYDVKFGYHVIRLLDEIEQIMVNGDLDLRRNREQLKAIRRGDMKREDLIQIAAEKEAGLERVYENCKLPETPDESEIHSLLVHCLEEHYGSIDNAQKETDAAKVLREINKLTERFA